MSVLVVVGDDSDPADAVAKRVEAMLADGRACVLDLEAVACMHDGVERGLRMTIGMHRLFDPRVQCAVVRAPDLAVSSATLTAAVLGNVVEDVASLATRFPAMVSLVAGGQRDFVTRFPRLGRAFASVDTGDDDAGPEDANSIAKELLAGEGSDIGRVERANTGASDLLAAMCATAPLSATAAMSASGILANAFYSHAALARTLSPVASSGDRRFRLSSASFPFVLGCCELLRLARESPRGGAPRGVSLSRYDKAAYMARRRIAQADVPMHPLCLAALHKDKS